MPNTGAPWSLRYPAGSDAPNINQHLQDLANDADAMGDTLAAADVTLGNRITTLEGLKIVQSLADSVVTTTVANLAVETSLVSFALPTTLTAKTLLRWTLIGDYLNNSGATKTLTINVKLGATSVLTGAFPTSFATNAVRRPWRAVVEMFVETTALERMFAKMETGDLSGTALGNLNAGQALGGYNVAAEDLTSSKTLDFRVTHSVAHASTDIRCHAHKLERVVPA